MTPSDADDHLRALDQRMEAIESSMDEIARQVRTPPQRRDLEVFVEDLAEAVFTRLDRSLQQVAATQRTVTEDVETWLRRSDSEDDLALVDIVYLLRQRVGDLEAQQRMLVEDLAADRKRLVDDVVSEISALLFGP